MNKVYPVILTNNPSIILTKHKRNFLNNYIVKKCIDKYNHLDLYNKTTVKSNKTGIIVTLSH